MNEQEIVDNIFKVRVKNNLPWKRLMELALKHAPAEAKAALQEINENDLLVATLMTGLWEE